MWFPEICDRGNVVNLYLILFVSLTENLVRNVLVYSFNIKNF